MRRNHLHWLRDLLGFGRKCAPIVRPRTRRDGSVNRPRAPRQRPWLEMLEERIIPAVLTVTSLADNLTSGDGQLTLREAFQAANTASTVDGVTGTGNDTIRFAAGLASNTITLTLNDADVSFGPTALVVSAGRTIAIDGSNLSGTGITISGGNARRVFAVQATGTLTLQGLTVTGGLANGGQGGNGQNDTGSGGGGAGLGGAIFNQGTLNVVQSSLFSNSARGGNSGQVNNPFGTDGAGGGGGGIGGNGGNGFSNGTNNSGHGGGGGGTVGHGGSGTSTTGGAGGSGGTGGDTWHRKRGGERFRGGGRGQWDGHCDGWNGR